MGVSFCQPNRGEPDSTTAFTKANIRGVEVSLATADPSQRHLEAQRCTTPCSPQPVSIIGIHARVPSWRLTPHPPAKRRPLHTGRPDHRPLRCTPSAGTGPTVLPRSDNARITKVGATCSEPMVAESHRRGSAGPDL